MTHFGVSGADQPYVFAFYTQGTVAIIGKWLEGGCRDEIDRIIALITRHTMAPPGTGPEDNTANGGADHEQRA